MPACSALSVGALKAFGATRQTAVPSALAEIAAFIALTISLTSAVFEPVHWKVVLTSAPASSMPYCVGVKNGFVVTWLTKTNLYFGVGGKLPAPPLDAAAPSLLLLLSSLDLPQAASAAASATPPPVIALRRSSARRSKPEASGGAGADKSSSSSRDEERAASAGRAQAGSLLLDGSPSGPHGQVEPAAMLALTFRLSRQACVLRAGAVSASGAPGRCCRARSTLVRRSGAPAARCRSRSARAASGG